MRVCATVFAVCIASRITHYASNKGLIHASENHTLPGDGIGPEVVAEGVKLLLAVAAQFGHTFEFTECLIGGIAIDQTGNPLPDATLAACRASDAVLLGAVGGPKWSDPRASVRPEQGLLGLRGGLGLFANIRPVKVYPALASASTLKPEVVAGVDMIIVRELTGGLYFGKPQGQSGEKPNSLGRGHHVSTPKARSSG